MKNRTIKNYKSLYNEIQPPEDEITEWGGGGGNTTLGLNKKQSNVKEFIPMYKNTDKLSNGKPTEDVNSLCKENYVRNPPCRKMPVALEIRDMQINSSVLKCNVICTKR